MSSAALIVLLVRLALAPSGGSPAEAAVATVLDDWHAAAASADEARYFGHYDLSVPIPNMLMKEIKQRIEEHGRAASPR